MHGMSKVGAIQVEIAGEVLENIFQECDRYDHDETGGRVVGHFAVEGGTLVVRAAGLIEAGPNARRTSTSFFQDGDYQTEVFRRLEAEDASIEHLGNWHTHHVNGYPRLSQGDVATYRRVVNHELHNLDFFYALLVTHRNKGRTGLDRYSVRHYVLFRGEDTVHEIRPIDVRVTHEKKISQKEGNAVNQIRGRHSAERHGAERAVEIRAHDQRVLGVLCPLMQPRMSSQTGTFFWKGSVPLIDGSTIEVKIVEVEDEGKLHYHPVVANVSEGLAELCETPFQSASHAVRALESRMNGEIYQSTKKKRTERWKC